jgi:hypothetical protein
VSPHNPGWDVFEEDHGGSTLCHDSQEVRDWPVSVFSVAAMVGIAFPFAGWGVRLAIVDNRAVGDIGLIAGH